MLIENISISCCVWTKPFAEEKKTINKIKIKGRKLPSITVYKDVVQSWQSAVRIVIKVNNN